MLKLSKKVEYAIIALMDLAGSKGIKPVTSKSVAENNNIPQELLGKVMQSLAKSGLLISVQGVKGGYTLGKLPEQITLKQVIEVLEGPISIIACGHQSLDECDCNQLPNCSIKSPMEMIQSELDTYFSKISLKDLKSKFYGHISDPVQLTV
jgi:Rrf2 family protein